MIWVWIAAAVIISWLFCGKKIAWYHYIWTLLPIEMYGLTIAGATIKPYMVFGIAIIMNCLLLRRARRIPAGVFLCALALLLSDILNGFILASVMQHIMFLLIIYIAYAYCLLAQGDENFVDSIGEITLSTTIGFGLVFIGAYILYTISPIFPGVYTNNRYTTGIMLRFLSTGGQSVVRLRGFCIDPNLVITTLIPGAAYALQFLLYEKKYFVKSLLAIFSFAAVMFLSGSRMAMICSILMILIILITGIRQASNKGIWYLGFLAFFTGCVVVGVLNFQTIRADVLEFFTARAGLNDTGGRFTIWKYNFSWLVENGRLLLGVGQNQIHALTPIGKACHNTWLEWICGTGIVIGSVIDYWIISSPITAIKKVNSHKGRVQDYMPLVLAYTIAAICITAVDNITNSTILFLLVIFRYGKSLSRTAANEEK